MTAGLHVDAVVERGAFRLEVGFDAAPGEVVGVVGPNGSGKTTLLRALAGLLGVTTGDITLDGAVLDDGEGGRFVPAGRRRVGLVFLDYRLFPHLSVLDNVAFAARSSGADRRTARDGARSWLGRLGLAELAARKPAALSGGQAQRVALARTLAAEPLLLLLDEPLAALDAHTRLGVRTELRQHLTAFPGPTLLVTHDPLEALVLADRLLVLEAGRIVQHGPPAEVARRPATQFVARLVGLNLYPGVATSGGAVHLDGGGTLIAAGPDDVLDRVETGSRVLVAIRPSALALHATHPEHASPRNVWPATVTGLEVLADRVRVQVTGAPSALVDITPDAVADLDLVQGRAVWVAAKATEVDVYADPGTGSARR